jgi:Fur family ferric uptake transcriptional regulator
MKEENSYEAIEDIFTEYLKKHRHRKTPERYAILKRIHLYEGHFNADVLYNSMCENYRVSLATVYNTLELLIDCKLLVKHQLGGQFAQYEKTYGTSIHHHLVCTHCGRIKEFSDKKIRVAIQSKAFVHFHTSHYSLYLYGLCSKCKSTQK